MNAEKQSKTVSKFDNEVLGKLRNNIRDLIKNCAIAQDNSNKRVLDIAPQDHLGAKEFFKISEVYTLDIDVNSNAHYIADLCECNNTIIPDSYFDIIVCTEVLEHTLNPFNAVNEIFRVMKPGGIGLISTPFNFRIHGPLPDCWRFTEHGLRELFKKFSKVKIKAHETAERFLMPYQYTTIITK